MGAGHGCGVVGNVLHRHLQGVVVPEDDHRHRVPHEDHVGTGPIDHPGTRSVIGGEHHQGVASTGHLPVPNGGNRALLSHSWPPSPSSALRLPAVLKTVTEGCPAVKGEVTHFTPPPEGSTQRYPSEVNRTRWFHPQAAQTSTT